MPGGGLTKPGALSVPPGMAPAAVGDVNSRTVTVCESRAKTVSAPLRPLAGEKSRDAHKKWRMPRLLSLEHHYWVIAKARRDETAKSAKKG